jgi:hypothetical protein
VLAVLLAHGLRAARSFLSFLILVPLCLGRSAL